MQVYQNPLRPSRWTGPKRRLPLFLNPKVRDILRQTMQLVYVWRMDRIG
jgi:hypothetical protein